MTDGIRTIIFPVRDLARSKAMFSASLGLEPYVDQSYYVGYRVDGQEIGLDPNGHGRGMTGPVAYWHVDDLERSLKSLLDAGAEAQQPVTEVGHGKVIATVKDGDGNVIGLLQQPAGASTS
jgi:predicted enzyme related to lactoylglutathione lyase